MKSETSVSLFSCALGDALSGVGWDAWCGLGEADGVSCRAA